jgi:hypothetical protein
MKTAAEPVAAPTTTRQQRSKPMLPVRACISLLDRNEDRVLSLLESGEIAWAFDVALDPKRGRNRELRILPAAVASYLRGQACSLEWADVLALLSPPDKPVILGTEITRVLNVCSTHTYALARRKLIVPCSSWRRGRGGCGRFTAASFTKFLKARRVL